MNLAELNKQDVGLSGINIKGVKVTKMFDFKPSKKEGWAGTHGIMCSDESGKALINVNTKEPLSNALHGSVVDILDITVKEGSGEYPRRFYAKEVEIQAGTQAAPPPAQKPATSPSPAPAQAHDAPVAYQPPTLSRGVHACAKAHTLYLKCLMAELDAQGLADVKAALMGNPDSLSAMANSVLIQLDRSGALYRDEATTPQQAAPKQRTPFESAVIGIRDEAKASNATVTEAIGAFGYERLSQVPADRYDAFLKHLREWLKPAPLPATGTDDGLPF